MDDNTLKLMQDHLLNKAKKSLPFTKHVRPLAYILCKVMELDEDLKAFCVTKDGVPMAQFPGLAPTDMMTLVLPLSYEDPDVLLSYMALIRPDLTAATSDISLLYRLGEKMGVEKPSASIVKVFKEMSGYENKDLAAAAIASLVLKTDAIAVLKIDETWLLISDKKEIRHQGSLEDNPDASEAICISLETRSFKRILVQPFTRAKRNEGPVRGFGELQDWTDTGKSEERLSGRFFEFFKFADQMKASRSKESRGN